MATKKTIPPDDLDQEDIDAALDILQEAVDRAGGPAWIPPERKPTEVITGEDADVED